VIGMEVFVLFYTGISGEEKLVGLFTNEKKARKKIEEYTFWDKPKLHIEVWAVH
jgi:hypothetical protein